MPIGRRLSRRPLDRSAAYANWMSHCGIVGMHSSYDDGRGNRRSKPGGATRLSTCAWQGLDANYPAA